MRERERDRQTERERERKRGKLCCTVCVQSYSRSDCELEDTTVSGVWTEEAGEGRVEVCVGACGADVNKHSPRCRGVAGSRAPLARRPCFRQSATAAPCPPR